ncbi:hypothetical protein LguiB_011102 [Lonicera macranthoides]
MAKNTWCKNYPVNYGFFESRPFFGQIFHSTHLRDGTPVCRSCERLQVCRNKNSLHRYIANDVEEGMCELIGQLWLKWCTTEGQFETRLKDYELYKITNGISVSAKNSYKNVKWAVDKYGLKATLDHMERWKALPQ